MPPYVDVYMYVRKIVGLLMVSQKIVSRLCGCCEGAVDSIISDFTQLHRSGLNLEFENLLESI